MLARSDWPDPDAFQPLRITPRLLDIVMPSTFNISDFTSQGKPHTNACFKSKIKVSESYYAVNCFRDIPEERRVALKFCATGLLDILAGGLALALR